MITVLITLISPGLDTGPFNLYSNTDGFVTPFATGISKAALLAGYTSNVVPNSTTTIRVQSNNGSCTTHIDLTVVTTTTTTSTSTSSTTTTSTTSTTSTSSTSTTTTSTTTAGPAVFSGDFTIHNGSGTNTITVIDLSTSPLFTGTTITAGGTQNFPVSGSIPNGGQMLIRITVSGTMTITANGVVATNTSKSTTGNGTAIIQITLTPSSFPNTCVVSGETDVTTP